MDFKNLSNYTNHLSILYIEDEEIVRAQFQSILEDFFQEAHSAKDPMFALKMYNNYFLQNKRYYSLLLVDIGLPTMDGIELSRQILDINPYQQIIIMSAYNEKEKMQELISLGITSFIPKPVNKKVFFEVIKNKARIIADDNLQNLEQKSLEYKKLEKEFELYKQTSNENISFLTQKNKSMHDKNITIENEIYSLLNKIEDLKKTIKELRNSQNMKEDKL